jgi:hypothetical protein
MKSAVRILCREVQRSVLHRTGIGHLETFDAATRIVDNLKIRCQDERNENNG